MATNPQSTTPEQSVIQMALMALEGHPSPIDDAELSKVSPGPVSLDLPEEEYEELFFTHCCTSPAMDSCIICGQPPRED